MSTHRKFKIGDIVWYASLGDGVKFKILDRCVSGELVLGVVESAYEYDGGWPIGRLMLADKFMLRLIEPRESEVERLPVYEVERDRYGVMYSGPLEVGECVKVVPFPAPDDDEATQIQRLLLMAAERGVEVEACREGYALQYEALGKYQARQRELEAEVERLRAFVADATEYAGSFSAQMGSTMPWTPARKARSAAIYKRGLALIQLAERSIPDA